MDKIKYLFESLKVICMWPIMLVYVPILLIFILTVGDGFQNRYSNNCLNHDSNHLQPDSTRSSQGCPETESDL